MTGVQETVQMIGGMIADYRRVVTVDNMISILKKEYPDLTFEHTKKLSLTKIIADLSAQYPQFEKDFSKVFCDENFR